MKDLQKSPKFWCELEKSKKGGILPEICGEKKEEGGSDRSQVRADRQRESRLGRQERKKERK